MIASLKGPLIRKSPEAVVIEANGVGFEVLVPLPTLYELPDAGAQVQLMIHTHVRENQVLLIGFLRPEEKEAFRKGLLKEWMDAAFKAGKADPKVTEGMSDNTSYN